MDTRKKLSKKHGAVILAVAATSLIARTGFAESNAVVYGAAGSTTSFNFAGLPSNSGSGDPPTALSGSGTASNPADLSTAFGTINSSYDTSILNGWYFAASLAPKVAVGSATTTTGGLFLSGTSSTQTLGAISTSSTGTEWFGVEVENTTSSPLNTLAINFNDVLFWQNTGAKALDFGYSVNTGPITASSDILPTSSLTVDSSLASSFATGSASSTYQTEAQSATITLGSSIPANGSAWLVWYTNTTLGTSQGVGINGLSLSLTDVANPAITWAKSSGTWDTTSSDWTGASTVFAPNDAATFANSLSGNSTITVQSGGASPGSTTVNNTTGFSYTFTGGSIGGSGAFSNVAGTTYLNSANTYSGGTNISGGTVIASGDASLGAANGGIIISGGGTLKTASGIGTSVSPSQRSITINSGGGTFNTNGQNSVFGTSSAEGINDTLTVSGGGNVEFDGPVSFTAAGSLNIAPATTVTIGSTGTISEINNSTFNGNMVITGTPRLNTDGNSTISGAGDIDITNGGTLETSTVVMGTTSTTTVTYTTYNVGVAVTNASGDPGGTINVAGIILNSGNEAFTPANVADPDNLLSSAQDFEVSIGGTKGGGITIDSPLSGNSDVNIGNGPSGGGAGMTVLNAVNSYTGTTLLNMSGTLQLAVNGAIPSSSNVIFGTISGAEGANTTLDLDGTAQTFASLSSGDFGKSSDELITNYGSNASTLTIGGSVSPGNKFKGTISDGVGGVAVVINGPNTIGLSGTNTYSLGTTLSGGTLQSSSDSNLGSASSTVTFNGGTLGITGSITSPYLTSRPITVTANGGTIDVESTTSYTLSNSPAINWGGALNFTDTGLATISQIGGTISVTRGASLGVAAGANVTVNGTTDPFTDSTNSSNHVAVVNNGNLTVTQVNSSIASINGAGTLTVGDGVIGNTLQIAQGGNSAGNTVGSLSILGNSTLDITNNALFINYGSGSDPITSIAALIKSGYGTGTWNGTGITTSMANVSGQPQYGIGYADYSPTYNPAGLSSGQLEIKYTLYGDANLDGKVNGTDFTLMAANFNDAVTNGWDEGDFNYSGTVNGDDFVLLANNFNQFAAQSAVSAADLSALDAFAAANGISLTSVPEPASMGLLAMGAIGLLHRRRRRDA
jgi:fibronectin-binding autotransporter adhesin